MTLVACTLVFFVITLDAVIVNVALPSIRAELGGGVDDLQWIVDGYTLMFAALLLSCGSLSDSIGAKRLLLVGIAVFVLASVACGLAPSMPALIASRFVQGSAAAAMTPASMALLNHAYPDPRRRTRAVAIWAMGGAIASTSGVFNTSRQVGGALAVAVFGLLLSSLASPAGKTAALLTAACVAVLTATAAVVLRAQPRRP